MTPIPVNLQGTNQAPALFQCFPGRMIMIHELEHMHRCFQRLAIQNFALANTFECFVHFAQRTPQARQLAPAITLTKAFGKSVEHLLKLYLQALEPRPQNALCYFR